MKLLDRNLIFKANLENVINAEISESINQEYTLSFSTFLEADTEPFLNHNHIVEANGDFFNIMSYKKYRNGGAKLIDVECEHVSYDLNNEEYDLDFFTEDGTPTFILSKILQGTGFTVGTVQFLQVQTFSIMEKLSRRTILLDFAFYFGAELKFDKYTVSLLQRRGILTDIEFRIGKNITGIEKSVDARELIDEQPKISYGVNLVELRTLPEFGHLEEFELGDTVRLLDIELGIDTNVRVVKYTYDPIRRINSSVEIQNFFSTLSDTILKIQRDTVIKGSLYHGIRISPENGFEAIRSDGKARAYFNSDTFAMQAQNAVGEMQDKIYFDPVAGNYIFDGLLSATAIEAISAEIDVVVSETVIIQNLYAEKGNIAELTVDQLDTSAMVQKRLANDTSDVNYMKLYGQHFRLIQAETNGSQSAQLLDRKGRPLYWLDQANIGKGTTLAITNFPVMVYVYEEVDKFQLYFDDSQNKVPIMVWGRGSDPTGQTNQGKGFILKDELGLLLKYVTETGKVHQIRLGESGIEGTGEALTGISLYDNGMFTNYDDGKVFDWSFTKNGNDQITLIRNNTLNKNITVTWNAGNK